MKGTTDSIFEKGMPNTHDDVPHDTDENLLGEDWLTYAVSGWRYLLSKRYRTHLRHRWDTQRSMIVVRDILGRSIAVVVKLITIPVLTVGLFLDWQEEHKPCCKENSMFKVQGFVGDGLSPVTHNQRGGRCGALHIRLVMATPQTREEQ